MNYRNRGIDTVRLGAPMGGGSHDIEYGYVDASPRRSFPEDVGGLPSSARPGVLRMPKGIPLNPQPPPKKGSKTKGGQSATGYGNAAATVCQKCKSDAYEVAKAFHNATCVYYAQGCNNGDECNDQLCECNYNICQRAAGDTYRDYLKGCWENNIPISDWSKYTGSGNIPPECSGGNPYPLSTGEWPGSCICECNGGEKPNKCGGCDTSDPDCVFNA